MKDSKENFERMADHWPGRDLRPTGPGLAGFAPASVSIDTADCRRVIKVAIGTSGFGSARLANGNALLCWSRNQNVNELTTGFNPVLRSSAVRPMTLTALTE